MRLGVLAGLILSFLASAPGTGHAEEARIISLVVSTGQGGARADAVQANLQVLGAETLRAIDPNNAELRSLLKRFADVAVDTDVAIVYLDTAVVDLEDRKFVLPAGTELRRASDLLTRALPLSAFARAAQVAGAGGAVFVAVGGTDVALPDGVGLASTPPAPRPGASPVVLAERGKTDPLLKVLSAAMPEETIELGALIRDMTAGQGVAVSAEPLAPIFLRRPDQPESAPEPVIAAIAVPAAGQEDLSVEMLAVLEQSISRSAKRRMQRQLRDLGHYSGLIDGIFGSQTRAAITAFQAANGFQQTGYLTQSEIGMLQ